MSSKKYAAPLQIELGASRSLLIMLLFLYIAAFCLVFVLEIELWQKLLVIFFLIPAAINHLGVFAVKKLPVSIVGLIWDYDDDWIIKRASGEQHSAELISGSFVHQNLSILNFKIAKSVFTQTAIILPDNIDKNIFRKLRVRLKITNSQSSDPE